MKYFVVGDVHGCLNQLKQALDDAGFDINNENHTLVSLGDNFDRGGLDRGVYKFLTHLPRAICLKGNHELILEDIFRRGYLTETDYYNGALATIASFAHMSKTSAHFMIEEAVEIASKYGGLVSWLAERPYYFETEHYIFTHGWVPTSYYDGCVLGEIDAATWNLAAWINTEEAILAHRQQVKANGADRYKTMVVGHWNTFRLRLRFDGAVYSKKRPKDYSIWEDKENKIIAIDACSNASKQVNVLVVED